MSGYYDMTKRLALAESIINYTFIDKALGLEALMMAGGFCGRPGTVDYDGQTYVVKLNTGLALVGDRQLGAHLCEAWRHTGLPKASETDLRNALAANAPLYQRGMALGLNRCIMYNGGTRPDDVTVKSLATTFEALIGAVHLDAGGNGAGYDAVKKLMEHLGLFKHAILGTEDGEDDEIMMNGGPVQSTKTF